MIRYLYIGILIMVIGLPFTGCDQKQQQFDNKQFKEALTTCLTDTNFVRNMRAKGIDDTKNWIIYSNPLINDTLKIGNKVYTFQNAKEYAKKDSTLLCEVTYPEKRTAHIYIKWKNRLNNRISGDFEFVYKNGKWILIKKDNAIT